MASINLPSAISSSSMALILSELLIIMEDAVIMVNDSQKIQFFNNGAEQIFGYAHEEVIGKKLDLLLPVRFRKIHGRHIKNFSISEIKSKRMGERRKISGYLRKSGKEFPAQASIAKIKLGSENLFMVIMRDISESVRLEEDLREANDRITNILERIVHDDKPRRNIRIDNSNGEQ